MKSGVISPKGRFSSYKDDDIGIGCVTSLCKKKLDIQCVCDYEATNELLKNGYIEIWNDSVRILDGSRPTDCQITFLVKHISEFTDKQKFDIYDIISSECDIRTLRKILK